MAAPAAVRTFSALPLRPAARAAAAASGGPSAEAAPALRTTTTTTQLRGFRSTAARSLGVKTRLRVIPALPRQFAAKGQKAGSSDDTHFRDTGNPLTREAYAKAVADSANADPCFRWLYTGGLRFYDMLEKPRNYLANESPYPMNPYYKAVKPISNQMRNSVFLQHQRNPNRWTPFRLAEEYGLSVCRVEAIIKSKRTELAMYRSEKETVENVFAATMDTILGAIHKRGLRPIEDTFTFLAPEKVSPTPRLRALPEEAAVDHQNVASALNIMSLSEAKNELEGRAAERASDITAMAKAVLGEVRVVNHDELAKMAPVIEPPNPSLANPRHSFCITDLANTPGGGTYGRRTLIRERDGSLREATPVERKAAIKRRGEAPDCFIGTWGKKYYKGHKLVIGRFNGVHRKIHPNNWF